MSRRSTRCLTLLILSAVSFASHAQQQSLTIDNWLDGKYRVGAPRARWTTDGRILLTRGSQTVAVDPNTGKETPAFDEKKLVASLAAAGAGNSSGRVPRMEEIDAGGKRGLFRTDSNLFVLDFGTGVLTKLPFDNSVKAAGFSPDGAKVAFVFGNNLYAFDLVSGQNAQLTNTGSNTLLNGTLNWVYWEEIFGRRDIGYWWSPDSKAIAFLETDESMVPLSIFVDPRQKNEGIIEQRYPKAGGVNPKVRAGVVEIAGGDTHWIGPDSATYEYILRLKWLPDSSQVALITMNRPQTDVDLTFAPRAGGAGRLVLHEHDDAYVNVTDDLTFIKGGAEFIWPSERTGYYHLYRYSADGKLLNSITQGDWALISNPGLAFWVRQAVCGVDEAGGWVYFATNKGDSLQRQIYRAKLDGGSIERVTREDGTHGVLFDEGATRFIDTYSAFRTAPSVSLRSASGGTLRQIAPADATPIAKLRFTWPKVFEIPARDGFKMPASIVLPTHFESGKKYPLIIYCYGGPSAPSVINQWQGPGWENILADHGYAVLTFDNRTATAISKKLESLPLKEYMSKVELNDLVDAAQWAKRQAFVDPGRVGVWGWSNGGTYVLLGMTRSKEFKAGIAVAAVVDSGLYDSKWTESMMKTPDDNAKGYATTELSQYAKDLRGRLLLVHGTYDDNVHPQQLWRFVDKLIDSRKMFDMMLYPMRKHGISDDAAQVHLYKTMLEFWDRFLKRDG